MTAALLALNSRTFSSLRKHRNYRLYFFGQIVSLSGTWMQDTALPWLILGLTHSPVYVGLLVFARYAPFMLFGLHSGVLADRFDNRRTVMVTQSGSLLVAAGLAVLAFSGVAEVWPYFVLAFLGGAALVFDAPNRHALTFQLVGRDELPNAVALNSSLFNAGRIIGPAIGGVLIAAVGVGWCFAINAASFLAVLTGLLLMRPSELYSLERRTASKAGTAIREGLRYVWRSPEVLLVLAITTVVAATGFNFRVLLPVLASKTLHADAAVFGVLFACFGVGALLGALAAAAMSRASWRAVLLGSAGFSTAMLLLAPVRNEALAALLLLLIGFCFATWTANSQSILQLSAPDHLRGRVLSLYLFAFAGLSPIGGLLAGWLASVGPGLSVLPSGPDSASAANLLQSDRPAEVLRRMRQQFDAVVIDTPPLSVADPRILGQLADGVLLVIRANQTPPEVALAAARQLLDDGASVIGTILNSWNPKKNSNHYSYRRWQYMYSSCAAAGGEK